jgi:hypothetical protein
MFDCVISILSYSIEQTLLGISNSHYENRFFESPPAAGFQKTDFGVSSAEGAGNTKIGFIMGIVIFVSYRYESRKSN